MKYRYKKLVLLFLFVTVSFSEIFAAEEERVNFYHLGHTSMIQGRFDEAEKHYKSAIESGDCVGHSHYNLGYIYQQQDKLKDAIIQYNLAIESGDCVGHSHYSLGYIYQQQDKLEDAITQYNLAIETEACVGHSHYRLGYIYQYLANVQENKLVHDLYLQLSIDQYKLSAKNAVEEGLRKEAVEELRRVRERLDPHSTLFLRELTKDLSAKNAVEEGLRKEAVEELRKVREDESLLFGKEKFSPPSNIPPTKQSNE